jgi:hypothetical protein
MRVDGLAAVALRCEAGLLIFGCVDKTGTGTSPVVGAGTTGNGAEVDEDGSCSGPDVVDLTLTVLAIWL